MFREPSSSPRHRSRHNIPASKSSTVPGRWVAHSPAAPADQCAPKYRPRSAQTTQPKNSVKLLPTTTSALPIDSFSLSLPLDHPMLNEFLALRALILAQNLASGAITFLPL